MLGTGLTDQSVQFIADLAAIEAETDKIDTAAIDGLAGVADSLGYDVAEIERHLHSAGHWYGKDPVDAFLLENGLVSWQVTAGAGGAFGNWVQLSDGTEIADPLYDPHLVVITQASASALYYVQLGTGAGGAQVAVATIAAFPGAALRQAPQSVQTDRLANTVLLWARCCCTTNGATISFVLGLHTYPG
jgi:hypothetical protein